jgi:hypothetical protein
MDGFFEGLYERFILRDIVGKVVPGFLVLLTLGSTFRWGARHFSDWTPELLQLTLVYAVSFVIGTSLQFIGTKLGWIRTYVWPAEIKKKKVVRSSQEVSLTKYRALLNKSQPIRLQRERLVVLKQVTGNFGMAAGLFSLLNLVRLIYLGPRMQVVVIFVCVAAFGIAKLLFAQSDHHADEQKLWEKAP